MTSPEQPAAAKQAEAFELGAVRIAVLPKDGADWASFRVDGVEYIHRFGAFQMFPTPARLAGCRYTFGGREILQRKRGADVFKHGLVRDETFRVERRPDGLRLSLDVDESHPVFEGYPFPCGLALTWRLLPWGAEVRFRFENRGNESAPLCYGLHPFWRLHGNRRDVFIRVPCERVMEAVDLVPTGATRPVEGTPLDLNDPRSLDGLDLDHVYWKRRTGEPAWVEYRALGRRLVIDASPEMTHIVVYSPPANDYVCIEPHMGSPNAQNISGGGGPDDPSGLRVAAPGESIETWMRFTVEETAPAR